MMGRLDVDCGGVEHLWPRRPVWGVLGESTEPCGRGLVRFAVQARALVLVLIACFLVEIR